MIGQFAVAWALACKDWRLFLADRRAAVLAFAVPVLLASGFGLIFHQPGSRLGSARLSLVVVVEDDGPLARQILDDLRACEQLEVTVTDRAEAQRQVARRAYGVALVLPAGFGRVADWPAASGGTRPPVELLHHPLSVAESQWAEGLFTEIALRRLLRERFGRIGHADALARPFAVARTSWPAGGPAAFNAYGHSFCGMTVQYLLFWGMESGLLLLRERQRGLWRRFRAAPVAVPTLLLGKVLATSALAVAQVLVTFAVGWAVFGVGVDGSAGAFAALVLAVGLLSAAAGLLVASLGGTEARARGGCVLVILAASLLGGLWLPAFLLPPWAQRLSVWLPTSWAVRGLDGVTWQGLSWAEAGPCVAAVLAFGAGFLVLAGLRFARSEARLRRGGRP